jgi:hypothetical protein
MKSGTSNLHAGTLISFGTAFMVGYFRSRGRSTYVTNIPRLHHKS